MTRARLSGGGKSDKCLGMNPRLILMAAVLLAGCSRHSEGPATASQSAPSESQPVAAKPEVKPGPPGLNAAAGTTEATLHQLTYLLRKYSAANQHAPASLNEVVSDDYLASLPAPPAGKKYGLDPKRLEAILVAQ